MKKVTSSIAWDFLFVLFLKSVSYRPLYTYLAQTITLFLATKGVSLLSFSSLTLMITQHSLLGPTMTLKNKYPGLVYLWKHSIPSLPHSRGLPRRSGQCEYIRSTSSNCDNLTSAVIQASSTKDITPVRICKLNVTKPSYFRHSHSPISCRQINIAEFAQQVGCITTNNRQWCTVWWSTSSNDVDFLLLGHCPRI